MGSLLPIISSLAYVVSIMRGTTRPQRMTRLLLVVITLAGLVIMLAGPFTLDAMLFPGYIALINFAFVAVIMWPRNRLATPAEAREDA
ncbi:MAG: hypothetical protein ABWY71_02350 [Candidatus Saccharimonadales bacterium]